MSFPQLIICVKNPFSERDLNRMGVEILERNFDVRILDCTSWLMPSALVARGESKVTRHNIQCIRSLRDFRAAIAGRKGGFAIDYVGPFSVGAVLMFNALKAMNIQLIVIDSGAYPPPDLVLQKRPPLAKLANVLKHGGFRLHINARIIKLLLRILPNQRPDIALVSGSSWQKDPRFISAKEKVQAHSFDYETYLRLETKPSPRISEYAVYLDENIAQHEDNAELGFANPVSVEQFYPALQAYFSNFERTYGLQILIAGYPSLDREADGARFGGRNIVYGKTAELIRNAKLVFAHASTAISFAVLWRKPIVFLTSDEIRHSWYQPWIEAPMKILSAPIVNISCSNAEMSDLNERLVVDSASYERYEEAYIKSKNSPEMSIWEILSGHCLAVTK